MKKNLIITTVLIAGLLTTGCNKPKRNTGRIYMPDMAYSRAYETYAATDNLKEKGIYYDARPVEGTVARGDMPAYPYKNDSAGYANSKNIKNPLAELPAKDYLEAARLYLVNCGICHGEKLDGNGPLWNGGAGPYPAAPKDLMGDEMKAMAEGTMFHSLTFGKNLMGSYASQLSTKQRWMIIQYIKTKQGLTGGAAAAAPAADNAATKK
jgi:mono/diheme cytochrome c family protein